LEDLNTGVVTDGCGIIDTARDDFDDDMGEGIFLIYKQKFDYLSYITTRPEANDLATTPYHTVSRRTDYADQLRQYMPANVREISEVKVQMVGNDYAFNVEDLVLNIGPVNGLNLLEQTYFEQVLSAHMITYWSSRKWAGIFDLEVKSTVVNLEFVEDFLYVEYEQHFRYRSIFEEVTLDKHQVVLEPFESEEGLAAFIARLGEQFVYSHQVTFFGTDEQYGEYYADYKANLKPEGNGTAAPSDALLASASTSISTPASTPAFTSTTTVVLCVLMVVFFYASKLVGVIFRTILELCISTPTPPPNTHTKP